MSASKLGIILFSSFLIFATAPAAQSTQHQTQDQTTKKKQKSTTNSEPAATSVQDVKEIQIELIDLGYNPGEPNGMMSSDTQQAIREFQYLNDLPVTGIVDVQTKTALDIQAKGGISHGLHGFRGFKSA